LAEVPLLRPEEKAAVDQQTDSFNASITPVVREAAKSTVRIWSGNRRLAYGTVVGDGSRILTKWSELSRAGSLRVEAAGSELRAVKLEGVYAEEDLALLSIEGEPLIPVKWFFESPALGRFLAAPQPDGRPAAFGVVSVLERNLRQTDQAYLGVLGDPDFEGPGVKIAEIQPESGAAAAGLRAGDVILRIRERPVTGLFELKNALSDISPGQTITILANVNGTEKSFEVLLGNRPQLPQFPGARLQQMERMGGQISRVNDSFSRVIQSDMRPKPNQIGGPVVDLQGRVIGVTMARAGRTRSYVMPAAAVEELLKKAPEDPALAGARLAAENEAMMPAREGPGGGAEPQGAAGNPDRLRRHLSDMQRLMELMEEEMQALESAR
jgi:S1-C subfamily serine protease